MPHHAPFINSGLSLSPNTLKRFICQSRPLDAMFHASNVRRRILSILRLNVGFLVFYIERWIPNVQRVQLSLIPNLPTFLYGPKPIINFKRVHVPYLDGIITSLID